MTDMSHMHELPPEEIAILDAALAEAREVWHLFGAVIYARLREVTAQPPQDCARLAAGIIDALRAEFGGQQPYLSVDKDLALSGRDRQIAAQFNGRNLAELAREHKLTPRRLYAIISAKRREDFEQRQGKLAF